MQHPTNKVCLQSWSNPDSHLFPKVRFDLLQKCQAHDGGYDLQLHKEKMLTVCHIYIGDNTVNFLDFCCHFGGTT